jgi:hypothetical protein
MIGRVSKCVNWEGIWVWCRMETPDISRADLENVPRTRPEAPTSSAGR